jgi:hypothetical protein
VVAGLRAIGCSSDRTEDLPGVVAGVFGKFPPTPSNRPASTCEVGERVDIQPSPQWEPGRVWGHYPMARAFGRRIALGRESKVAGLPFDDAMAPVFGAPYAAALQSRRGPGLRCETESKGRD